MLLTSLLPVSYGFAAEADDSDHAEENGKPTAMFGTPQLGADDPLWDQTKAYPINRSTLPEGDPRPRATGTVRILWDDDYVYARVEVQDSNLYVGPGGDHTYDSVEFFVGPGSSGSNQWRVSATGVFSGQSHTDRAAWTRITDDGYIVEIRIPRRDVVLESGGYLTFEVNINNSTEKGGDRYEVVSAFGTPDAGFTGDESFRDSVKLIDAIKPDPRLSVIIVAEPGGRVEPNAPGNVLRVEPGTSLEFTIKPDKGKIVDTVTVDGQPVTVGADNAFTLTDIRVDTRIHVTFKDDPAAEQIPFIVWNDNFARGEYTTAVIIDLGEGREAKGSALRPDLFAVSHRDTTLSGNTVFEGERRITRVYANDEPKVRGYLGEKFNSPDYRDGLESGRYIVIELEFYTEVGGHTTLDENSNSTVQHYGIVLNGEIALTKGGPIRYAVFKQTGVVNPILDKFTTHTSGTAHYALYLHKDQEGHVVKGLPLYIYTHGFSRGGTQAHIDQKASMKSANGAVALMKRMEENFDKYASHILNISYNGTATPQTDDVKRVIDELIAEGLVDPDRIYAAGFSWGGAYTNTLINAYPGFFAAAATLSPVFGSPDTSRFPEEHRDLAYWMFINAHNVGIYQQTLNNFITNDMPNMTNARATRFESNEALTWPYNQYDQPSQRPNPDLDPPLLDYIAHEVEAAVLYNRFTMDNPHTGGIWSIAPTAQSPNLPPWNDDYTDLFDWMFSQRRPGVPDAPGGLTAVAGDGKVTLKWTAPAYDGGKPILGYKVWYDDESPVPVDASTYEYTFTGLNNGQEYTFKVVAVNEKGDSAAASVKATPRRSSYPVIIIPGGGGTGQDTDSELPYTLKTPEGSPAVKDQNGNTILPGGGEIVTGSGIRILAPAGTTIAPDGEIVIGSGGAAVIFESGLSLNIRAGAKLVPDEMSALGFSVASGGPFRDVDENAWFYRHVVTAYTFGLFNGTSSATFSPGTSMTRAMFVQVLANLEQVNRSGYRNTRFKDVADRQWYTAAVAWAAETGIVNGVGADRFDPHAPITREQMIVMLYNYMKSKGYAIPQGQGRPFADEGKISPWALEAVHALQSLNIITGRNGNLFDPKGVASRAEVAAVFVRLIEYLAQTRA